MVAAKELKLNKVLIVVKKSLMFQWSEEIQSWCGEVPHEILSSTPIGNAKFNLTYYEALFKRYRDDNNRYHMELRDDILKTKWDMIIADEATALKNRKAARSKAILKLARRTPYVVLMTGTPIHNRPDELWHLLHILNPKEFSSYWRFVEQYCIATQDFMGYTRIEGFKNEEKLAEILDNYMLRRTEVEGITEPIHEVIRVRLSPYQSKIYSQLAELSLAELGDGNFLATTNPLVKYTRFRQIACSPYLFGGKNESSKTEALLEFLAEHTPYTKVVVFSTLAEYLKLLFPRLKSFNPVMIIGEKTGPEREQALIRFREDDSCRVMLTTMREGLNLQETADTLVFMDKDWVPALVEQVIGRVNRRGQNKQVKIVTFVGVIPGVMTLDEYIEYTVLPRKEQYSSALEMIYDYVKLLRMGV